MALEFIQVICDFEQINLQKSSLFYLQAYKENNIHVFTYTKKNLKFIKAYSKLKKLT